MIDQTDSPKTPCENLVKLSENLKGGAWIITIIVTLIAASLSDSTNYISLVLIPMSLLMLVVPTYILNAYFLVVVESHNELKQIKEKIAEKTVKEEK